MEMHHTIARGFQFESEVWIPSWQHHPYPTSLSDPSEFMRKPDKASKGKYRKELSPSAQVELTTPVASKYINNGGWLIHQIPWKPGSTFKDIARSYNSFIKKNFANRAEVVFDSYDSCPSIKEHEYQLQQKLHSPKVQVSKVRQCQLAKNMFLSNTAN